MMAYLSFDESKKQNRQVNVRGLVNYSVLLLHWVPYLK